MDVDYGCNLLWNKYEILPNVYLKLTSPFEFLRQFRFNTQIVFKKLPENRLNWSIMFYHNWIDEFIINGNFVQSYIHMTIATPFMNQPIFIHSEWNAIIDEPTSEYGLRGMRSTAELKIKLGIGQEYDNSRVFKLLYKWIKEENVTELNQKSCVFIISHDWQIGSLNQDEHTIIRGINNDLYSLLRNFGNSGYFSMYRVFNFT